MRSYKCLKEEGFNHYTVNHSITFCENGININKIEGLWSHIKKIFKIGSSTRKELIQSYLDFFSFYSFAKYKNKSSFDLFLEIISKNYFIQ